MKFLCLIFFGTVAYVTVKYKIMSKCNLKHIWQVFD